VDDRPEPKSGQEVRALATEARRRHPQLQIVLATGYAREAAGGDDRDIIYLGKPYHCAELPRQLSAGGRR
jgi:hypothetical protein